jgi:arylformamidase
VAVEILFGATETLPFHAQAQAMAEHFSQQKLAVSICSLPNANHMSSVSDLGLTSTRAGARLAELIESINQ